MKYPEQIAIVGSRGYPRADLVRAFVKGLAQRDPHITIVSGGARGVDTWAYQEASKQGLRCLIFPADWDTYGWKAGMLRNGTIVAHSTQVVAFWDGVSRGTRDTIMRAIRQGKKVTIISSTGERMKEPDAKKC